MAGMGTNRIDKSALTPRQLEVLKLIAGGRTNSEIAAKLGISLDGAKWHVTELLNRIGVSSREELIEAWEARERGPVRWMRGLVGGLAGFGVPKLGVVAGGLAVTAVATGAVLMSGSASSSAPAAGPGATATQNQTAWFIELALWDIIRRDDPNVIGGVIPAVPSDVVDSNAIQRPIQYSRGTGSGGLVSLVFTGPMPEGDFFLWLDPHTRLSAFDKSGFHTGSTADAADRWYVRFRVASTALGDTVRLEFEPTTQPTPTPVP